MSLWTSLQLLGLLCFSTFLLFYHFVPVYYLNVVFCRFFYSSFSLLFYFSLFLLLLWQHKQEEADRVKKGFAGDSQSDHIAFLNAFMVRCLYSVAFEFFTLNECSLLFSLSLSHKGWERCRSEGGGAVRQYCWDNFLANNTLEVCVCTSLPRLYFYSSSTHRVLYSSFLDSQFVDSWFVYTINTRTSPQLPKPHILKLKLNPGLTLSPLNYLWLDISNWNAK